MSIIILCLVLFVLAVVWVVTASYDGTGRVWDGGTGAELARVRSEEVVRLVNRVLDRRRVGAVRDV